MKRIIPFLIIAALIAGGYYYFQVQREQRQAQALASLQTLPVERGNLTASIGATGTVRANQTAVLAWQTSGTIEEVTIAVGETVTAGQQLAYLAKTSIPQSVILAEVDLVDAQEALAELLEPPTELAIKQAEQAIAHARDKVRSAENRVNGLQTSAAQADIDQARSNVVLAKDRLDRAREDFRPYENKPEENLIRANLQSRLAQAQKDYDAAVSRLNNLLGTTNEIDLDVAQADLALAQAELAEAEEAYQDLINGAGENDIAAAEARIAAAQAAVNLQYITAPFNGVVSEVVAKPGDLVTAGSRAFRIDDLSRLLLDVQVSEVDINRIQAGQPVLITFDAILGKEYHGVIDQVGLVGNTVQGVVEFTVTVELTDADESVRPGMTAGVNIVISELQDVLLIPNRAVRVEDGQRVVYVLRNGIPQAVAVELGASSETSSQVLDGDLKQGDPIVLNPPAEFTQDGPPPFVRR